MENKDKISIFISILALVISIIATINTEVKTKYEKSRIIRSQLTDVLGRITKLNIENAKNFKEYGQDDPAYHQIISSILNQENASLLHQAMYLSEQIPNIVSAVDLNTIAYANANAGDLVLAEVFFLKAIDRSSNDLYKALATRSYANFLFPQRRFEEARQQYRKSVSLLKGGDILVRYTNGMTYQMWATNELYSGSSSAFVDEIFSQAKREFSGIDNKFIRTNALKGLEAAKSKKGTLPDSLTPNILPQTIP